MDTRQLAKYLAYARLGIGAALTLAPGAAGRIWVGEHGDGAGARVFARAIGARDVLLGARALASQNEGGSSLKKWTQYEAGVDLSDAIATLLAAKHLTPGRRVAMPLIAASYAALNLKVASQL